MSAINNPQITIFRAPNHRLHLPWRTTDYTIIRANSVLDHDLRENNPGAQNGPVDAYAGLGEFSRTYKIRTKFNDARQKALEMIKARVRTLMNHQASEASLASVALEDFLVWSTGPTLSGAGKAREAAEWRMTWVEGNAGNPRRTWTFVIDSDNPLDTSSQDPHVGWTVSALAGSQAGIGNQFGHIWLDHVPVMRE